MMKLKDYSLLFVFTIFCCFAIAQQKVSGIITDASNQPLNNVEVFDKVSGKLAETNSEGYSSATPLINKFGESQGRSISNDGR